MIKVKLYRDRRKPGELEWFDKHGRRFGPVPVLGKADNRLAAKNGNPTRDPERRYGDTPTGKYEAEVDAALGFDSGSIRSYGKAKVIRLSPIGGAALRACTIGKRAGLLIHGGDLSASGALRPTNGCLRLSNEDQAQLVELIREHMGGMDILEAVEIGD